jgi:hypothetical protein
VEEAKALPYDDAPDRRALGGAVVDLRGADSGGQNADAGGDPMLALPPDTGILQGRTGRCRLLKNLSVLQVATANSIKPIPSPIDNQQWSLIHSTQFQK